MGNRGEKREKLLHYTREVNHSMCWKSQNGTYTHVHAGTCMGKILPVSDWLPSHICQYSHEYALTKTRASTTKITRIQA